MLDGRALDSSSVLPLEELLELLDLPEHESSDLPSSSFLSQPDESLVVPELELLDDVLLDDVLLLLLSPLLPELLEDSPDEPLELSSVLPLLEDVAVVVSPPQLSLSLVVEVVVPVLDAPQPSSATTSSSPSSS